MGLDAEYRQLVGTDLGIVSRRQFSHNRNMNHMPRPLRQCTTAAFTLVELSIVLVILGLLVGGVLTGQSLIRAAELRTVMTEYTRYSTAVSTFRDKYFAIPGDMPNATNYWGTNTSGCPGGGGTTGTCNGNGDGLLGDQTYYMAVCENQEFWRHLSLAGLIEGTYTPYPTSNCYGPPTPGTHVPKSKISSSALVEMVALGSITSSGSWPGSAFYTANYGNAMLFGALNGGYTNYLYAGSLFTPAEAYNIDMKSDDGRPDLGKIMTAREGGSYSSGCATSATPGSAAYLLSGTTKACGLIFITGF